MGAEFSRDRPYIDPRYIADAVQSVAKTQLDQLGADKLIEGAAIEAKESNNFDIEGLRTLQLENERLQDELTRANDLHGERKYYANRLFGLIVCWLIAVVVLVFLTGDLPPEGTRSFKLSDTVLVAFITSTTVSVIGLFVIVAKWLFPSDPEKKKKNKKKRK